MYIQRPRISHPAYFPEDNTAASIQETWVLTWLGDRRLALPPQGPKRLGAVLLRPEVNTVPCDPTVAFAREKQCKWRR